MRINIAQALRYSVFLAYPLCYVFWVHTLNQNWVNNNIRFLHPEVLHPTQFRYEPNKLATLHADAGPSKESLRKRLERNLVRPSS